jgi:diguanylate cyclase (GGDEF)-like protein
VTARRPAPRRTAFGADQIAVSADQTASDTDQTASDTDQTASDTDADDAGRDASSAAREQELSNLDQASADLEEPGDDAARKAHDATRVERAQIARERAVTAEDRRRTAARRDETAVRRDLVASERDASARQRDERAAAIEREIRASEPTIAEEFEALRVSAAGDRDAAARDRARAARDRAEAARLREALAAALLTAHLDDLTGAYRREMGRLALVHEIARARRGDGRLVLAFVDVDDLKGINDRDGHAAGDAALVTVVAEIRASLRPFDPVMRYGGDEFVIALGAADLDEGERRFEAIRAALLARAGISISVGLARLEPGDTVEELTARADADLYERRGSTPMRTSARGERSAVRTHGAPA